MLEINISNDTFRIQTINKASLENLYAIYQNTDEFKFATGLFDLQVAFNEFSSQIYQFASKDNNFLLDIILVNTGVSVGFIKGTVLKNEKVMWINIFAIDKPFQSKGIGKNTFYMIENYFRKKFSVTNIFLTVYKNNVSGMKFWEKCSFKSCGFIQNKKFQNLNQNVQVMWKII